MRIAFLSLVVVGFAVCIVRPFLLDWDHRDRYPPAVVYVTGLLVGLVVLARAERTQALREREWLEERRESRAATNRR